nr:hypothetical protein [Planctomycetota bacterium]
DEDEGRWYLAVAQPGQGFGAPLPLHEDYNGIGAGKLALSESGLLTILYSVSGTESGTWARQYVPGQGLTPAADISGISRPVAGSLSYDALNVETNERGDAVAVAAISVPGGGQTIRGALLPFGRPWTLGVELATEPDRPTGREVRIVIEPSTGAFIQWIAQVATSPDPIHYVLRTRRLRSDGTLGNVGTYGGARQDVIANTHLAMTPEGKGLLVFDKLGDGLGVPTDVFHAFIN